MAQVASPATAAKTRGRPLSFDRDIALEKAMRVFWEHGYEAASVSHLTHAMGITPPSLYTAFGDKARLFMEAIEFYGNGPGGYFLRAMEEEPTARGAVQRLLVEAAAELTQAGHPPGCMMVMAATNCSVAAGHVQQALVKRRALGVETMQARIQRGIDERELPPATDAFALATFYATVFQGMSMQAKDGAAAASLGTTVEMAMRAWPAGAKLVPAPRRQAAGPASTVRTRPRARA